MVIPADGPSLGTAPSGTWMCRSFSSKREALSGNIDFTRLTAICTDSFMTSPSCPVTVNLPLPLVKSVSMKRISPPAAVHASPVTMPGFFSASTRSCLTGLASSISRRSSSLTTMGSALGTAGASEAASEPASAELPCFKASTAAAPTLFDTSTAADLHSVSRRLRNPRTPDSIV